MTERKLFHKGQCGVAENLNGQGRMIEIRKEEKTKSCESSEVF